MASIKNNDLLLVNSDRSGEDKSYAIDGELFKKEFGSFYVDDASAPIIDNVQLVSRTPDSDSRFSEETFDFTTTMAQPGDPLPGYGLKASVGGALYEDIIKTDKIIDVEGAGVEVCETELIESVSDITTEEILIPNHTDVSTYYYINLQNHPNSSYTLACDQIGDEMEANIKFVKGEWGAPRATIFMQYKFVGATALGWSLDINSPDTAFAGDRLACNRFSWNYDNYSVVFTGAGTGNFIENPFDEYINFKVRVTGTQEVTLYVNSIEIGTVSQLWTRQRVPVGFGTRGSSKTEKHLECDLYVKDVKIRKNNNSVTVFSSLDGGESKETGGDTSGNNVPTEVNASSVSAIESRTLTFPSAQGFDCFEPGDVVQDTRNQIEEDFAASCQASSPTNAFDGSIITYGIIYSSNVVKTITTKPFTATKIGIHTNAANESSQGQIQVLVNGKKYQLPIDPISKVWSYITLPKKTVVNNLSTVWHGSYRLYAVSADDRLLVQPGTAGGTGSEVKVISKDDTVPSITVDDGNWYGTDLSGDPDGDTKLVKETPYDTKLTFDGPKNLTDLEVGDVVRMSDDVPYQPVSDSIVNVGLTSYSTQPTSGTPFNASFTWSSCFSRPLDANGAAAVTNGTTYSVDLSATPISVRAGDKVKVYALSSTGTTSTDLFINGSSVSSLGGTTQVDLKWDGSNYTFAYEFTFSSDTSITSCGCKNSIRFCGLEIAGKLVYDGATVLTLSGDTDLAYFRPGDVVKGGQTLEVTDKTEVLIKFDYDGTQPVDETGRVWTGPDIAPEFDANAPINWPVKSRINLQKIGDFYKTNSKITLDNGIVDMFIYVDPSIGSCPVNAYRSSGGALQFLYGGNGCKGLMDSNVPGGGNLGIWAFGSLQPGYHRLTAVFTNGEVVVYDNGVALGPPAASPELVFDEFGGDHRAVTNGNAYIENQLYWYALHIVSDPNYDYTEPVEVISINDTVPSITVDGGDWYADPANDGDGSGEAGWNQDQVWSNPSDWIVSEGLAASSVFDPNDNERVYSFTEWSMSQPIDVKDKVYLSVGPGEWNNTISVTVKGFDTITSTKTKLMTDFPDTFIEWTATELGGKFSGLTLNGTPGIATTAYLAYVEVDGKLLVDQGIAGAPTPGDTEVTCLSPLKAPTDWTIESINTTDNTMTLSHDAEDNSQVWVADDNQAGIDFYVTNDELKMVGSNELFLKFSSDASNNRVIVEDLVEKDPGYFVIPQKDYALKFKRIYGINNIDVILSEGADIRVNVKAANYVGEDNKWSNIVIPELPLAGLSDVITLSEGSKGDDVTVRGLKGLNNTTAVVGNEVVMTDLSGVEAQYTIVSDEIVKVDDSEPEVYKERYFSNSYDAGTYNNPKFIWSDGLDVAFGEDIIPGDRPTGGGAGKVIIVKFDKPVFCTFKHYSSNLPNREYEYVWTSNDGVNWDPLQVLRNSSASTTICTSAIAAKYTAFSRGDTMMYNLDGPIRVDGIGTTSNFYLEAIESSAIVLTLKSDSDLKYFQPGDVVQGTEGGTQDNWTQYVTTGALGSNPNTYAFDGNLLNGSSNPSGFSWDPPAGAITWADPNDQTIVEVHTWGGASNTTTQVNSLAAQTISNGANRVWLTFTLPAGEEISTITNGGPNNSAVFGIRVNGVLLVDNGSIPDTGVRIVSIDDTVPSVTVDGGKWDTSNQSQVWSNNVTGDLPPLRPASLAFDGYVSTVQDSDYLDGSQSFAPKSDSTTGGTTRINFDITVTTSVVIYAGYGGSNVADGGTKFDLIKSDGTTLDITSKLPTFTTSTLTKGQKYTLDSTELSALGGQIKGLELTSTKNSNAMLLWGIEVDGKLLVDQGVTGLGDTKVTHGPVSGEGEITNIDEATNTYTITPNNGRFIDWTNSNSGITYDHSDTQPSPQQFAVRLKDISYLDANNSRHVALFNDLDANMNNYKLNYVAPTETYFFDVKRQGPISSSYAYKYYGLSEPDNVCIFELKNDHPEFPVREYVRFKDTYYAVHDLTQALNTIKSKITELQNP